MIFDFIFLVFAELTNNGPIFETDFASKIRRTNCVFHIRFDFKKIENGLNILHCLCIIISLRSFSKSIFTRFLVGFTVARVSMFSVPLRKLSASTEYKLRLRFSFFWHFFFSRLMTERQIDFLPYFDCQQFCFDASVLHVFLFRAFFNFFSYFVFGSPENPFGSLAACRPMSRCESWAKKKILNQTGWMPVKQFRRWRVFFS